MHKIIFAAVITSCFAIPVHAEETVVDRPDASAGERPTLDQLMKKFAEHEARYSPFHITYRETFRMVDDISDEVRKRYPWGDGRTHGREKEVAQTVPRKWMKVEAGIVNNEVRSTYKWVCTTEGIHHFCEPGTCIPFVPYSKYPCLFTEASPLLGVFPLRMTWPCDGELLSEYFGHDRSNITLSWDGPNAVLDFVFGTSETLHIRFRLWLSAAYDWHPIRLQRFFNPDDEDFHDEWEATKFYHSTIGRQVRAGRVRHRAGTEMELSGEFQLANDQKESAAARPDSSETGPVGSTEQRQPIAYSVEFVVVNSTYGTEIDEAVFAVTAPPNRVGEFVANGSSRKEQMSPNESVREGDSEINGPSAENLLNKARLSDCEMHVVGMYMPQKHSKDDRIYVEVKPTGNPIVLVMTGYFGAEWHLKIDPKADLRQIIVPGYYEQAVAKPHPDVPIKFITYYPNADIKKRDFFWAYAWHSTEGRDLRRKLKDLTGLDVKTFQGEYQASEFVVDGRTGLIQQLDKSRTAPAATANAAADAVDRTLADTSVGKAIDRRSIERMRDLYAATYRDAEQESAAAAAKYRDEAAQKSPDADALKSLQRRLQMAVKKSFEAQIRLQETRLQLAELDLQNVKAKLERRKTLGKQVIARRIEDLKTGSDLSWQTAGNLSGDRGAVVDPTIASRGIEHRENISQKDAPASSAKAVENDHGDGDALPDFPAGRELLYFHASYCQPCQKMDPFVKDLAKRFPAAIRSVDITKLPEVVREHRIDRIPTMIVIENNVEIARSVGLQSKERLLTLLKTPTETSTRVNMGAGRPRDPAQEAETTEAAYLKNRLQELNERFEELKLQKLIEDKFARRNPAAKTAATAKQRGFPTPLELLNQLSEKLKAKDYLAVARMLPEDEVLHEAGMLVVAAKAVEGARKVGAAVDPVVATLENVVDSQLLANPPDDAARVLENTVPITTTVFSLSPWLNEFDKHRNDPVQRKRMRQIAGVLKDPAKLLAGLAHEFEDSILTKPFTAYGDPRWDIAMDGEDRCRVGNINAKGRYATLDLKRTDNGWVIARFFADAPEVVNAAIVMEGQAAVRADASKSTQTAADRTKLLADWLKQARALGDDAEKKRDKAVREIAEALNSEQHGLQIAAATALAQLGDVKFDKKKFRPRILELCRSKNAEVQCWAFYALLNTERQDGDLELLQEVMAEPVAGRLAESASHLLQSFDEGVIRGKSEEIVVRLLNSSDKSLRREALRGLWGAKYGEKITNRVIELVDNKESHHDAIYYALSTSPEKTPAAIDKLIEVLSDPDWNNWGRAIWGLGYGVPEDKQAKVAAAMLQMYELRSDPKTRGRCERLVRAYGDEQQIKKLETLTGTSAAAVTKPKEGAATTEPQPDQEDELPDDKAENQAIDESDS